MTMKNEIKTGNRQLRTGNWHTTSYKLSAIIILITFASTTYAQNLAEAPMATTMFNAVQSCHTTACIDSFARMSGFTIVDKIADTDGVTLNYRSANVNSYNAITAPNLLNCYVCADSSCADVVFITSLFSQYETLVNAFKNLGFVIDLANSTSRSSLIKTEYTFPASQNFFLQTVETPNTAVGSNTYITVYQITLEYTVQ